MHQPIINTSEPKYEQLTATQAQIETLKEDNEALRKGRLAAHESLKEKNARIHILESRLFEH